jgi:peptidoglycan hydrolase-like protein with peptidoglycan-binding domain
MNGYWSRETRRDIQRILSDRGYYSGSIDGDIGSGTRRAIERFLDAETKQEARRSQAFRSKSRIAIVKL